ncbi:hypothetical protein [Hydrogenimonas sp. SS33]|uniref:hypothetical protein n=1 Tax=Hydrogenimonas leucolamina TaxID=2954236 RepID=UPI00336C00C8
MKWLKRTGILLVALLAWAFFTGLFLSKERLCNLALQELQKEQVTLCFEERKTSPAGCEQKFTTLLYGHSPIAKIKALRLTPWSLSLQSIRLEGIAASLLPPRIEKAEFHPLTGTLYARGDFGTLEGTLSYRRRRIRLVLTPSSLMKRSYRQALREFKPKNGKYLYETGF